MKIVALGRQSGKSLICLDHLGQNANSAMVVHSCRQRDCWKKRYPHLRDRIFTVHEALKGKAADFDEIYVDDLDWILYDLFGQKPVVLATLTQDDADACLPGILQGSKNENT